MMCEVSLRIGTLLSYSKFNLALFRQLTAAFLSVCGHVGEA